MKEYDFFDRHDTTLLTDFFVLQAWSVVPESEMKDFVTMFFTGLKLLPKKKFDLYLKRVHKKMFNTINVRYMLSRYYDDMIDDSILVTDNGKSGEYSNGTFKR